MTGISTQFWRLAAVIMQQYQLVVEDRCYAITALELYLAAAMIYDDGQITHRTPLQLTTGKFYVHGNGRRSPQYSGIDITCGDARKNIFGGLLIRGLDFEDGPAKAAVKII